MALSVFFGMPMRDALLSELDIFTAYPPRSYYPEASVAWGQLKGSIANQTDLTDIMFTKAEGQLMNTALEGKVTALQSKNALQDVDIDANKTAIANNKSVIDLKIDDAVLGINSEVALKANTIDVDSKNALQDVDIGLRAVKTEVVTALSLKADTTAVNAKNALQDTAIAVAQDKADAAIPKAEKGKASGVATLGTDGKVMPTQLPPVTPVAWGNITGNISAQTDLSNMYFKVADFNNWAVQISSAVASARVEGDFYATTTAEPANAHIAPNGDMKRSTAQPPVLGTAATRNIGAALGQIPVAEQAYKAAFSSIGYVYDTGDSFDVNTLANGVIALIAKNKLPTLSSASPSDDYFIVEQQSFNNDHLQGRQVATGYRTGAQWQRIRSYGGVYESGWQSITTNPSIYVGTTASGANVCVANNGQLLRSTSSERYKDILAPLVLDDARYADAMALKPIVYRSTADADNQLHHYYSFSAEELGAYDPAFTLWRTTETVTDADGNTTEQPLAERQAEGININALLAMSHAIAIKQDQMIKLLSERVVSLEIKQST